MNSTNSISSINSQNIWAMNFANALLVYGFVYFYFRTVKPETKFFNSILWGIYYLLSAIGFYSFLNFGMLREWSLNVLVFDMVFAVAGGVFSGALVKLLYDKLNK